jgi:hypothetical protein
MSIYTWGAVEENSETVIFRFSRQKIFKMQSFGFDTPELFGSNPTFLREKQPRIL